MKLYFSILFTTITLLGCKDHDNNTVVDYAYIGGEIINPNTDYIVLSREESILDTIKLDGKNRFIYKIKNIEAGLYTFRHGGEYQMVLLEPKDSILFRLNTLDFDESLVFTGRGDKKNNYLINAFLTNEQEEKHIVRLCQLNPKNYQKHVDSLKYIKINHFKKFDKKHELSTLFKKIVKTNIDYSYYSSKEVYPFIHYGKDKAANLKSLPDNFYSYRKEINYNDEFLNNHSNYKTFLRHSFNNLSLKTHNEHANHELVFNRRSLCYNLDRLKLIDSLVTNAVIKDDLLYHFATHFISKSKNQDNNNAILKSYLSKSKNEKSKQLLTRYTNALNNLKEGNKLPIVNLLDYNNNDIEINTIITKPTVISFWSHNYYQHFKESHYKINALELKYPEVNFITINTDAYGIEKSKKTLLNSRFDFKNEYQFKDPKEGSNVFAVYPMTKTIMLDKNKTIINNNSNLFSIKFEEQLLGLINR